MGWEDNDIGVALLQTGVNVAWVLLPLVPAIVIYRIFPDTKVAISGPLQALSVRASGAFAAYLIVFLTTFPLIQLLNENLSAMYDRQWLVRGTVTLQDANGRQVSLRRGGSTMTVSLRPDIITLAGNQFEVIVPEINDRLPSLLIEYPGFESYLVTPANLRAGRDVRVDPRQREIDMISPVMLRAESCVGPGC